MKQLNALLQAQFDRMCATGKLFRSTLTGQEVWDLYLSGFGNDPVFRDPESSEHNCNLCNNFIRRYGNIVAILPDGELTCIFDVNVRDEYGDSCRLLTNMLINKPIADVFFETFEELNKLPYERCHQTQTVFQLGIPENHKRYTKEEAEKFGVVKPNEIRTFNHFSLSLPAAFVDKSGKSIAAIIGEYRDAKNVFLRAMQEIPLDTLMLVRDLIVQGSLLNGDAHLHKINQFIPLKCEYDDSSMDPSLWAWNKSYGLSIAKFKNELIGVLCSELAEGKELNKACEDWNKRVDPVNYMKASAPITKRQIEEAKKFVEENGYSESFSRRFATADDIRVSEILHANIGDGKIKTVSLFDNVKATSTRHKRSEFDKVEEVNIDKFMSDILPTCNSIEAFLAGNHEGNMVSLTTSAVEDSKPIFKWSNNYSWTFNGNLAGKSQIKEAVKTAGGRVDGVLRFSLIWNDADGTDNSDLDAWCQQPNGERIGYSEGFRKDSGNRFSSCGGQLDLDNTQPSGKLAIENIYFADFRRLKEGNYKFWVNQFAARNSGGFKAEIEFEGEIFTYEYNQPVRGDIPVANVTFKDGKFSIEHKLPESGVSSKELYGLETNQFHKVNLVCLSPNHWGDNRVGNKHYFFMLEGCRTPAAIRTFHNENLIPELLQHRKVTEVLANTTMISQSDDQLSGLGFNATVKDELVVRLSGTHKRVIKIKF